MSMSQISQSAAPVAIAPEALQQTLAQVLGERVSSVGLERGEVTVTVLADRY